MQVEVYRKFYQSQYLPEQHSGSFINGEESATFVMRSASGQTFQSSRIWTKNRRACLTAFSLLWFLWDVKEPTPLFEKSRTQTQVVQPTFSWLVWLSVTRDLNIRIKLHTCKHCMFMYFFWSLLVRGSNFQILLQVLLSTDYSKSTITALGVMDHEKINYDLIVAVLEYIVVGEHEVC